MRWKYIKAVPTRSAMNNYMCEKGYEGVKQSLAERATPAPFIFIRHSIQRGGVI
jgi:hypothetical protein